MKTTIFLLFTVTLVIGPISKPSTMIAGTATKRACCYAYGQQVRQVRQQHNLRRHLGPVGAGGGGRGRGRGRGRFGNGGGGGGGIGGPGGAAAGQALVQDPTEANGGGDDASSECPNGNNCNNQNNNQSVENQNSSGNGWGGGGGGGGGGNRQYMTVIHQLVDNHELIDRTVDIDEDNGIITTETTSENQQVRSWIRQHVEQMKELVENSKNNGGGRRIRQWDPLFVAMFDHADKIDMGTNLTDDGIQVKLVTDGSECAMSLAEAHAWTVSAFIDHGRPEVQSYHDVPAACRGSSGD